MSSVHPFCDARTAPIPYDIPGVPGQGPLLTKDHLESWTDVAVTLLAMGGPSVAAMAELWLRLFSSILAPLGIAHLLYIALQPPPPCTEEEPFNPLKNRQRRSVVAFSPGSSAGVISMMCLLTTAASAVLLTDTQYVLEYGPVYGGFLLAVSAGLSIAVCRQHRLYITLFGILCILVLTVALTCDPYSANNTPFAFGDPNDAVLIEEGLYYDGTLARYTKDISMFIACACRFLSLLLYSPYDL